ncbi:DnaD domain-containing protein [Paenibacillus humicola]|uniref:DnaD domain-containing protein n=1 Tax=Paenibacillus humicola TaxID=3110540 RepID=UPI00237B8C0A|nr:DnaD domain-containing protein [Paenibacillus humicola]
MKNELALAYARGMAEAMNAGAVTVPAGVLMAYRDIGMSDSELLLIVQMMLFRQLERTDFPTPEELSERLGIAPKTVQQMIGRLMKEELLAIDEEFDPVSGIQSERYNWNGLIVRCAERLAFDARQPAPRGQGQNAAAGGKSSRPADLFTVFEQEFGRPLSPMECETISAWLDQDRYPDELIRFALKEAVFAGKLHFRYIDRILIEWSRNRVTNTDEAKAHAQKFRGGRGS